EEAELNHRQEKSNRNFADERKLLSDELKELLQNDEETQHEVLRAVCGKVKQSQYQPNSIPFELFQNADDALIERVEILGQADSLNPAVSIIWNSTTLH